MPPNNDELMEDIKNLTIPKMEKAIEACKTWDTPGLINEVTRDLMAEAYLLHCKRATPPPSGDAVRVAVEALEDAKLLSKLTAKWIQDHGTIEAYVRRVRLIGARIESALSALRALPADQGEFMYASSAELFRELGQSDKQAESSERGVEAIIRRGNMAAVTADQPDEDAAKALDYVELCLNERSLMHKKLDEQLGIIRAALQQRVREG